MNSLAAKKPLAKVGHFLNMLGGPRGWIIATLKRVLMEQMQRVLGDTASLRMGRLTVYDIRQYLDLAMAHCTSISISSPQRAHSLLPPARSRGIGDALRQGRFVLATVYLHKLATAGIKMVRNGQPTARAPHPQP